MTPATDLLDLEFDSRELGERVTIAEYFIRLAQTVWQEGESFSGKRPWGNSSWQYEVYTAMIQSEFISGNLDRDGYVEACDTRQADGLIYAALDRLRDRQNALCDPPAPANGVLGSQPPPAMSDWEHSERVLVYYPDAPEIGKSDIWSIAYYHYNPPFVNHGKWVDHLTGGRGEPAYWWPLPVVPNGGDQ